MSADNWAVCPRCLHEAEQAKEVERSEADAAYGVLPEAQFYVLRKAADEEVDEEALRTFREDYEFYFDVNATRYDGDGSRVNVIARYKGGCTKCSLSTEFWHLHPLWERPT